MTVLSVNQVISCGNARPDPSAIVDHKTALTANSPTAATLATGLQTQVTTSIQTSKPKDSGSTGLCAATTCIDFAAATVGLKAYGNKGGGYAAVDIDPADGSNKVLKVVKKSGDEVFLGTNVFNVASTSVTPIVVTATNNVLTLRVYSDKAGQEIALQLETPAQVVASAGGEVVRATTTKANTWETLSFTFPKPNTYTRVSIMPLLDKTVAADSTFYFDELTIVPAAGATAPVTPGAVSGNTGTCTTAPCLDFSGSTTGFVAFEGLASAAIAADPVDATNKVAKYIKGESSKPWGGATIYTTDATLQTVAPIDLVTQKTVTLRVYSPAAGEKIGLKIETGPNGGGPLAQTVTTKANAWETLTFDFTTPLEGTVSASAVYKTVSIFPAYQVGTVGADKVFYFDELKYKAAAPVVTPPVSTASVIVNFDEATPGAFEGFDGGVMTLATDAPAGGSGKVAKIVRNHGATWAGAKIAVAKVPLTATRKTLTARVWSSKANAKIQLKLENAAGTVAFESPAGTPAITAANTWQTMTFDVSGADLTANYTSMVMLPDNGTQGSGEIYYFDDITLVDNPVVTPSTTAEMGSAGAVTIPVAVAADNFGFIAVGDAVFAGDYVGSLDSTNKLGAWPNATTTGLASNGNIGYYNDPLMGSSAQKVEEGGWVSGTNVDANGVHNFFRYFTFTGAASTFANSYMGLFVNAPNNGKVNVSTYANMKLKVWGPAEMYNRTNFHPTLEVILAGPKVAGCTTTGSGGTELSKTFSANQTIGAGSNYKLPLTGWTVKGVCGTDTSSTAVASVLGGLARVAVNVPGSSFNFTNANTGSSPAAYSTGVNLGPIAFTNN